MDPEKSPSPPPETSPGEPPNPAKRSNGVSGFLRIRRSRKVAAEQDPATLSSASSSTAPPSTKKRFLRRSKKNKEVLDDASASASGGASSTPSITPTPSPKPKKSTKASSLVRKLSIGRYRRSRMSPANTDTSEDERRQGCVTPPPPSMIPPPEEDETQEAGDQWQRAPLEAGGGSAPSTPVTPTPPADPTNSLDPDMKCEPDAEAEHAGTEAESDPSATAAATAAPKTPTRSQFLSITTPVITKQKAMQDFINAEAENERKSADASAADLAPASTSAAVDNPLPVEEENAEETQDTSASADGNSEDKAESNQESENPADIIANARLKLSQSLSVSRNEPAAQYSGEKREHLYKILVIGELGTGKTSIIKRYVHQFFSQHYRATIGVDFALKVLNWDPATIVRLQLWDIAGQERFGNMTRVYYKEAVGAFIVFDVTRAATFDAVLKWKQDLDSKVQMSDGSPIPCVLLANKCDQPKEGLVNTPSKMEEYCNENGFTTWFETSAKENVNIDEAARALVAKILQNDRLLHGGDAGRDPNRIALDNGKSSPSQANGNKSCLC